MKIIVLSNDELTDEFREKIITLDKICFPDQEPGQMETKYFAPTYRHILLFDGEILVSYLRTILRRAKWKDGFILIGGIGSVATAPKYRGKGFALQIVRRGMRELSLAGADIGLLQTDVKKAINLYGKAGFVPVNFSYTVFDSNKKLRTIKAKDVMIAPICNHGLFNVLVSSSETLHIGSGDW